MNQGELYRKMNNSDIQSTELFDKVFTYVDNGKISAQMGIDLYSELYNLMHNERHNKSLLYHGYLQRTADLRAKWSEDQKRHHTHVFEYVERCASLSTMRKNVTCVPYCHI